MEELTNPYLDLEQILELSNLLPVSYQYFFLKSFKSTLDKIKKGEIK